MSQSIAAWPADEPTGRTSPPAPRRSRGVWLTLVGVLACVVFTSLAGWKYLRQPRSRLGGTPVSARTMPDGTVLVLERATARKPHEMTVTLPGGPLVSTWFRGRTPGNERRISAHPHDSAIVLWFTRWHPGLPDSLDFDWWLTNVLTDKYGAEIEDGYEQSFVISAAGGLASRGASRPWAPLAPAKGDIVIATSQFPALRQAAGPRRVKVFDRMRKLAAEFEVPFPDTSAAPQWTPDALPVTKSADDVQVTFTDVAIQELSPLLIDGLQLKHPRPRWSVAPVFRVERDGAPAPEWKAEPIRLTDALGNVAWSRSCRLSTHEQAWKLELTLSRDAPQALAADEQWQSPPVALPDADSSQPVDHHATVQNVGVSLVSIGRGATQYREFASSTAGLAQRTSGSRRPDGKTYGLSHSSRSTNGRPTKHEATITGDCAHLLLKLDHLPPHHRELFRIHDDQGRELPHQTETFTMGDTMYAFLFVDPAPDAQGLRATVYVHTARTVELLLAPPRPEKTRAPANQ